MRWSLKEMLVMVSQPEEAMGVAMPHQAVGSALVLIGAKSFRDAGIANLSDTYRGQILVEGDEVRAAIIKEIPLIELVNEVLAAALGAHLNLPVPAAFLCIASPEALATRQSPKIEGGDGAIVFASSDAESPSLAQLVVSGAAFQAAMLKTIVDMLVTHSWIAELYGFDAWAANVDRHVGNILIGGHRGAWLIDHGRCFTGPDWDPETLDSSRDYTNRLREWMTPCIQEAVRARLADEAGMIVDRLYKLDIMSIAKMNHMSMLLSPPALQALVDFLRGRIPFVPAAAAEALEQKRLPL